MVTLPAGNEERVVRYLLDELGEEERRQLEDRLFHEPELFELVHSVEDDLILKFVRGELEAEPASRFSEVYMNDPAKRTRVESARAWRQAAGEVAAASKLKPSPAARIWLGLAAAATAAAIVLALLLPSQRKQSVQQFVQTSETPSFVRFVLEPGLTRSDSGGGVEIKVPPGIDLVHLELTLPYPGGQAKTYHALLGSPERPNAWNGPAVLGSQERPAAWKGAASRNDAMVVASVPAQVLLAGDYTVDLEADGKDVATYSFRVAK